MVSSRPEIGGFPGHKEVEGATSLSGVGAAQGWEASWGPRQGELPASPYCLPDWVPVTLCHHGSAGIVPGGAHPLSAELLCTATGPAGRDGAARPRYCDHFCVSTVFAAAGEAGVTANGPACPGGCSTDATVPGQVIDVLVCEKRVSGGHPPVLHPRARPRPIPNRGEHRPRTCLRTSRPTRGLSSCAQRGVVSAGRALEQNLRRGHYAAAVDGCRLEASTPGNFHRTHPCHLNRGVYGVGYVCFLLMHETRGASAWPGLSCGV